MPQGAVTFLGRGLAYVRGQRIVLTICPVCSQRNDPKAAERGHCLWCAYEPTPADVRAATADGKLNGKAA
ncbi:hypothetical protein ASG52_01210 [Methylobacterium sp. Leaf456]|uniref:hypothetical protein n=1 Tax=Methylobacterium sp. Leaf456 TaxID=1736382 RepID=UPI0006F65E93|nr:hypothetical protein [Methylobacterium sp. Leaf456]KQT61534.1 hypothetical protein ASG52_01210 [Methylobacterium sp. Leaf456]